MIRAVRLIEHRWALSEPRTSAAGSWNERQALLLIVEDAAGRQGLGEAAPLPGYSRDSLDAARDALGPLLGRELPARDTGAPVHAELGRASAALPSSAARMALESALLDLWARQTSTPAWRLLAERDSVSTARLAAWLPDGVGAALAAAEGAQVRGIDAFKVKLDARRGLEPGVATLETLRRTLGPRVRLRADANQSASPAALEPYLARLRALELEWLEEPTAEPPQTPLGVPLALDESLPERGPLDFATLHEVVALVLKPTALGGLARSLELAAAARAAGRSAVASHTLEGPLGYMACASLAIALGPGPAHGLGPHSALHGDRPPALAPDHDEVCPWPAPGFGLDAAQALLGAEITRELRP